MLAWHQDQDQEQARSVEFDDIYASSAGAMAEKSHVFLQPNQLEKRFHTLSNQQHFSLLELGFGTGLNFLLTWQLWQRVRHEHASAPARLIYTSIESRPLQLKDIEKCHQQWPELQALSRQLQAQYPLPIKGFHRLEFADVKLLLIQAPVMDALAQFHGAIDALYLDGFSPAKNADMWSSEMFKSLAKHCHAQTSFATYSVARAVKDGLSAAGFYYQTIPGFGQKKHQLVGGYQSHHISTTIHNVPSHSIAKEANSPWQKLPPPLPSKSSIAVIGAGISGCMTALALQARGYDVQLIEQADHVAAGASGNRQGVLYTKIPEQVTVAGQLHQQGLQYSVACLRNYAEQGFFHECGVMQLASNATIKQQLLKANQRGFPDSWLHFVEPEMASQLIGFDVDQAGLYFKQSGWLNPGQWCQALVTQLHNVPWLSTKVVQLAPVDVVDSTATAWRLQIQRQQQKQSSQANRCVDPVPHQFAGVVFCNAYHATELLSSLALPLGRIRGQVTYVEGVEAPNTVVCSDGYITPAQAGLMGIGASYGIGNDNDQLSEQDQRANLYRLQQHIPHSGQQHIVGGRASFRANTPDYLPLVGGIADTQGMLDRFNHLRKDKYYQFTASMPWLKGLYINAGHGSKGLITAPLCAQLLAAQISAEPLPISKTISDALSANRFFYVI